MHRNFLLYVLVILYATLLVAQCKGRDLRPSDHGLYYEEEQDSLPPAQSDAATEMRSFFGKATSNVPLPEAKDIGDANTWWNVHKGGKSRDTKMDHVRVGLLVASLVCGLIGIVLLAVSGVVFLFRLQKKRIGGKGERLAVTSGSGSDAVSSDVKK